MSHFLNQRPKTNTKHKVLKEFSKIVQKQVKHILSYRELIQKVTFLLTTFVLVDNFFSVTSLIKLTDKNIN